MAALNFVNRRRRSHGVRDSGSALRLFYNLLLAIINQLATEKARKSLWNGERVLAPVQREFA